MEDVEDIKAVLRADERTATWLEHLEAIDAPEFEVALPTADDLPPILLDLAVPHEEIDGLVAMLPLATTSPGLWWLLERCTHSLTRTMGTVELPPWFPALPKLSERVDAMHRYFFVYVFLATLPHVRAFHRSRAIPGDISRRTLADLGRHMAVHRRNHGIGGFENAFWLMLHFRGAIYELGRLQFERARLGKRIGAAVAASGLPYGPGDPALAVHIPAFSGPMSPSACDASFARARDFFARHFPEERYEIAICNSWLLDEQLADYLPEESNIIRFQRRFRLVDRPDADNNDASTVRFVFGLPTFTATDLPRRTTLERAIGDHLRSGRHWHGGVGWLTL